MQDGGVIPDSGFPRDGGMANEEGTCKDQTGTVQTYDSSHTTHAFGPRMLSRGYTFEACVFGAVRVVEGSSRSRAVVEVDVHGSSWEVVVHGVVEVVVHVATVVVHVFVDVRGHDEELDVHGIFEGRR